MGTLVPVRLERGKWLHSRATQLSFPIISSDFLENPPKNSRPGCPQPTECFAECKLSRVGPLGARKVELVFLPWVGRVLLCQHSSTSYSFGAGVVGSLLFQPQRHHCSGLCVGSGLGSNAVYLDNQTILQSTDFQTIHLNSLKYRDN